MTLFGAFGKIGSGKSFKATEQAIILANEEKKNIIANYPINLDALWLYAIINKLDNIIDLLNTPGSIQFFDLSQDEKNKKIAKEEKQDFISNSAKMFDSYNAVIVIDEAGIFLNSRNWHNTDMSILQRLCQSRKRSNHAFVISQSPEQIDTQLRGLLQYYLICSATTRRGNDGNIYMVLQNCKMFEQDTYLKWKNSKHSSNPIKTRMSFTMRTWSGPLMCNQLPLFSIYNSYDELDQGVSSEILNYIEVAPGIYSSDSQIEYKKFSQLSSKQKIYYSILRIFAPKIPAPGWDKLIKITEKLTYYLYELYKLSQFKNILRLLLALSFALFSANLHITIFFISIIYLIYEIIKFIYYAQSPNQAIF